MERSRHPWTTRALLCPKERDPDFGPRENGERGDRTPERAGADCHWFPLPSAATMAGRSLPSMTAAAVGHQASPAPRLRCPGRRHPQRLGAEGDSAEKTARAPPPPSLSPGLRKSGYLARGWAPGYHPEEEDEEEEGGLRPTEIWEIWKICSALGDSCSLRTRTGPQTPDHSAAPHPPVEGMGGSGEGARTAPAGSPCAGARALSRDHWGPALSGSRELPNSLKMPGTFLLWD